MTMGVVLKRHNFLDNCIDICLCQYISIYGEKPMALQLYTKEADKDLIEEMKIKAMREKTSLSEVAFSLLKKWYSGELKIEKSGDSK